MLDAMSSPGLDAIAAVALARLSAREAEVPETGAFEPIVERGALGDDARPVVALVLRIGAGQGAAANKRFLDVRVGTTDDGSDSSTWILFCPKGELFDALRVETTLSAVVAAARSGIEEIRRHGLR